MSQRDFIRKLPYAAHSFQSKPSFFSRMHIDPILLFLIFILCGVGLLVLGKSSGFRTSSGTSLATAYVSGIAALAVSTHSKADYATLRAMLEISATDLGTPGKDAVFGAGIPSASVAISGLTN